jgi:DsbC/DsbD-like thiol-disulfide interchange protein
MSPSDRSLPAEAPTSDIGAKVGKMHGVMRGAMHFLLAGLIVHGAAPAQTILPDPAKTPQYISLMTSASATTAAPGSKIQLFVDVTPNAGIHVYAPGAKEYLPIEVALKPPAGVSAAKTIYPKSERIMFAQELVPAFQKPFRLVTEITLAPTIRTDGPLVISGVVNYQACDDLICFKPAVLPVMWKLNVP